jgi:hypothetical protein
MQLALMGAAAIAVIAVVIVAIRRARLKRTSAVAVYYSEPHGPIVARNLREDGEVGADSDPLDARAEAGIAQDRLLEPPEWPDALSARRAERAGVG